MGKAMEKDKGTPYFKGLNRKDYIIKVSNIIKEEGVEAISIRKIAKELGCSSASLYRYFENLDELLYYAHLDSLNEYIQELSKQEKNWEDIWDVHFGIWRAYAYEAFKKVEAFECIFYRNINKNLGKALEEYYDMFPDAIVKVSPIVKEMLTIPEYYGRDYYMCCQLAKRGKIRQEDASRLNHLECTLFLGYFKEVQELGIKPEEIKAKVEQFMEEIKKIAGLFLIEH